ncbi:hypothetical protein L6452_21391 [Arctium lappa]|uniref:Uncharacterized protein n=1 Tax=Arctium lappa TaxID=4217 RepID=A0ACB9BEU3_ARCLA|nr:hypothetical protein L6452_21391 [Arctium lappa]
MDHSFNDRVDKVFGSISSSSSSSSTPWSLTDAQVERRLWNRDKGDNRDDDQTLVSSSFHDLFKCQRDDTQDHGDEWDIRSFIGLDATLDNEEEEDAYDKMAEGREDAGDRIYMKDVTDHGPYLNSHNILPCSLHDVKKDPRANHDAAKTRLKEDNDVVGENPVSSHGIDEVMLNAAEPCVTVPASEDGTRIKSILKRKNDDVVKPAKRVRFDSTCKNEDELTNGTRLQGSGLPKVSGSVPDYILNPSKYTQYSIDEFSRDANTEAYLDFLEQVKNSKDVKSSGDMPRSVLFIPKKKRADGEAACNGDKQSSTEAQTGCGVGIAAVVVQQGEISQEMQEEADDVVCTKDRSQKPGRRQYRTKMGADDDIC